MRLLSILLLLPVAGFAQNLQQQLQNVATPRLAQEEGEALRAVLLCPQR